MAHHKNSIVEVLAKKTSLIIGTITDVEFSPELITAIQDDNLGQLRELVRSGSESVPTTLEAIVKTDKTELLQKFVDETDGVKVADGDIVHNGRKIGVMKFTIRRRSLQCALAFMRMGVRTSSDEHEELVKVALAGDDAEAIEHLIEDIEDIDKIEAFLRYAAELNNVTACDVILCRCESLASHDEADTSILMPSGNLNNTDSTVSTYTSITSALPSPTSPTKKTSQFYLVPEGNTPLHLAAKSVSSSSEAVMETLIRSRPQLLDKKNCAGRTPLHEAANARNTSNTKYLISKGAQLSSRDRSGISVIHTITMKTPRAMEEFKKKLDDGITLSKDASEIRLDFSKINLNQSLVSEDHDMLLFQDLAESPFKDSIEHPLCQAFLYDKFSHVKKIFIALLLLPHFIFSVIYSVFSGVLFGQMCAPDEGTSTDQRWNPLDEIPCQDDATKLRVATVSWTLLAIFQCVYGIRELIKLQSMRRMYFVSLDAYRNLAILAAIGVLLVTISYPAAGLRLQRWQYHLASLTCFLLWIEMMHLVGKLPRFGKYVQMFWSVTFKIFEFSASYIWLVIGFMMAFMILFSRMKSFNDFPGPLINVLVMMLGELDFKELYYPSKQILEINNSVQAEIVEEDEYQQFPGTAMFFVIMFVLMFCIVIMNLLVGLAVSDINKLMKTGNRDQLIAQIELVSLVLNYRTTFLFHYLTPAIFRKLLDRVLYVNEENHIITVHYSDLADKKYPEYLKQLLYKHCVSKENIELAELRDINKKLQQMLAKCQCQYQCGPQRP